MLSGNQTDTQHEVANPYNQIEYQCHKNAFYVAFAHVFYPSAPGNFVR